MARYRKKSKTRVLMMFIAAAAIVIYALTAISEEAGLPDLLSSAASSGASVQVSGDGQPTTNAANDCEVHFIDVGQGDSQLILSDGKAILIDGGENDQGAVVVDYLNGIGVEKIDLLVATHPHSDHIGGLDVVVNELEVGQILMPRLPDDLVPTTRTYTDLLEAIQGKDLKITAAKAGAAYTFGKGVLTVLGPQRDYDDLNNTSLVCRFDYDGRSFLFTGDIETPVEKDMLKDGADLQADVLALGHHGSSTSTSKAFFREVDPAVCVISCGEGNSYGHPHKETLATLSDSDAQVFRTDYQGSIVIGVADGELTFAAERGSAAA